MALTPSSPAAFAAAVRRLSQSISESSPSGADPSIGASAILGAISAANPGATSAANDVVTLSVGALNAANQAAAAPARQDSSAGNIFAALRSLFNRPQTQSLSAAMPNLLRQVPNRSSQMDSLFKRIGEMLDDLKQKDPELAGKLEVLIKTLEKLSGYVLNGDGFLTEFERVLNELHQHTPTLDLSNVAATQSGQSAAAAPAAPRYERVTVAMEIEISSSSSVEATIAEMTQQGMRVQQVKVEQSETVKLRIEFTGVRQVQQQQSEPLALDLNGDGVQLTDAAQGVNFDINGDGIVDRAAFAREDGFLAMDSDGNGQIDSGKELFGDQNGAANGFEELAKLDDNRDGVIDARDAAYKALGVIRDANADGRLDPGEFMSLEKLGIKAINLINDLQREDDGKGNTLAERGTFVWSDGREGKTADAWLAYTPGQAINKTA
ncbi:MAG: hypothetical protein NTX50_07070 [Candidatus Sumerlaeota bacterium]|nr:hypothetical protein [Candidatus Sumerlaeota bacterium]